jgi:hypothetical protein
MSSATTTLLGQIESGISGTLHRSTRPPSLDSVHTCIPEEQAVYEDHLSGSGTTQDALKKPTPINSEQPGPLSLQKRNSIVMENAES